MIKWIDLKLYRKVRAINKRMKEIKYAHMMYGCDAWGTNAFDNIQTMKKLEKEYKDLNSKKAFYQLLRVFTQSEPTIKEKK